ncbi:MAG TPA: hypothetical protein IAB04_06045 [Candidatus Avimonoglobus intestinipullorum]|uniref:Uncharacterized protein n=1 Tax=Candidatus Avimonoglobus intestinipullorum TaxID=2840699 RepID=A0A9D1S6N8_9FIRM|nr:hypothetical protein [Candidatus Avimonoglobus intestinipullorum]
MSKNPVAAASFDLHTLPLTPDPNRNFSFQYIRALPAAAYFQFAPNAFIFCMQQRIFQQAPAYPNIYLLHERRGQFLFSPKQDFR